MGARRMHRIMQHALVISDFSISASRSAKGNAEQIKLKKKLFVNSSWPWNTFDSLTRRNVNCNKMKYWNPFGDDNSVKFGKDPEDNAAHQSRSYKILPI